MTKHQFIMSLARKLYENEGHGMILFDDGSRITEEMLIKLLDAMQE